METEAKDSKFPPHSLIMRRIHRKSPVVKLETLAEESNLQRKRKTSSLSLLYPPRPRLAIVKRTSKIEFDDFKLQGEIPVKEMHCKCKQSSCVKMYCLCFASSKYCNGCSCSNCQNTIENEEIRQTSIGLILQRNQKAFRTMVSSSPEFSQDNKVQDGGKNPLILVKYTSCCCKRSQCIQGYCECYHANTICSKSCKCKNCRNSKTYEERSLKESNDFKDQENFLDSQTKRLNCMLAQSWPIFRQAAQGPLNFHFRSLLADIIRLQNLIEFCKLLIVASKAVNALSDKRNPLNLENLSGDQSIKGSAVQIEHQDKGSENQGSKKDNNARGVQVNMLCKESTSDAILQTERPISPETLPLMCNEKDVLFHSDASSNVALDWGCYSDVYVEQERIVLVKLRDFLNGLIASGKAKGKVISHPFDKRVNTSSS